MANKSEDKKAPKKSAARKSETKAAKKNVRSNPKKTPAKDTEEKGRASSSRIATAEKPPEQASAMAEKPVKKTGPDESALRLKNGPRHLKKWHEKAKTGPNAIDFPVVAIGASAGGLEAFEQFFTHMPPDTGMAFVIVQHLDPSHKSILAELIRRYTTM